MRPPGKWAGDTGSWGGWKPAWIEDLQATVHASALLFNTLDMWSFWTTMAARFESKLP
jgi:hypothetical protein